jgi:hypothetical protein
MFDKYGFLEKYPSRCQRVFGVKFKDFQVLLGKVQFKTDQYLIQNPLANRGLDAEFSLANQLLLTLEYLKSAPTFEVLGFSYGISESYAYKCYHSLLPLLAQAIGVNNPQQLQYKDVQKMVMELNRASIKHINQQPLISKNNEGVSP